MTRLSERILAALSRPIDAGDLPAAAEPPFERALDHLTGLFPDLAQMVAGKRVLDVGCGLGHQAVALARAGADRVLGVDINATWLESARELARTYGVHDRVEFASSLASSAQGAFDVVISQNAMEHFTDPAGVLATIRDALVPGGVVLLCFEPPWFAPYGAHMHFFTRVPWVHLLFPESAVMAVRTRYRADGARRYEEVEGGLNRMSLRKFERLVMQSGLQIRTLHYQTVKGIPAAARVPLVRELFVNGVSCILIRPRAQVGR